MKISICIYSNACVTTLCISQMQNWYLIGIKNFASESKSDLKTFMKSDSNKNIKMQV